MASPTVFRTKLLHRPRAPWLKGAGPPQFELCSIALSICCESSCKSYPKLFIRVTVHWKKNISRPFSISTHWLWIDVNSWRPKITLWSLLRMGDYGSQVIDRVLTPVWFTLGLLVLRSHPVVISPVTEHIFGIDVLSSRQNFHIGSLTHGMRAK